MFNEAAFETLESLESIGESTEWNEGYEYSERRGGRGGGRPLPVPNRGNPTVSAPQPGYATKAELEATANRLDGRIGVNTKAIEQVNGRVSSLGSAHNRLDSAFKREKAANEGLRQQIENMRMAVMLTPLISTPKTVDVKDAGGNTVKAMVDDGDTFRTLLPVLLMSGGFGGTGTGASGSAGGTNDMMLPLLAIAMSKK